MKFSLFHLPSFFPQFHRSGVTNISLLPNFGGLDHTKVMASLDRFAKYVMPKFKK